MNSVYCYHCMTYHQPEAMRKIVSRGRTRWRCIRSIEASRRPVSERDAFGRQQSQLNLAQSQAQRAGRPPMFAGVASSGKTPPPSISS